MTAIWDNLSWKATYLGDDFDEFKSGKLKICMTAIYNATKDRKEYAKLGFFDVKAEGHSSNTLKTLKTMIELESWKKEFDFDRLHWLIESLHNFDHANGGHHTENVLIGNIGTANEKRENKKHWETMKDFQYDEFWKEGASIE